MLGDLASGLPRDRKAWGGIVFFFFFVYVCLFVSPSLFSVFVFCYFICLFCIQFFN